MRIAPMPSQLTVSPDQPNLRPAVLAALAVGALDLVTKLATVTWLADDPIDLGFVTLTYHQNPGIAFSIGNDLPFGAVVAITSAAVVLIGVATWRGWLHPPAAAGLMLGGGLANLVDRVLTGSVVDMIDLGWWPAFNIADAALNIGVAVILVAAFLNRDEVGAEEWSDAVSAMDRATSGPSGPDRIAKRADQAGDATHRASEEAASTGD